MTSPFIADWQPFSVGLACHMELHVCHSQQPGKLVKYAFLSWHNSQRVDCKRAMDGQAYACTPTQPHIKPVCNSTRKRCMFHVILLPLLLQADLLAMRTHLGDHVEYFEADLTAYSTIRSLKAVDITAEPDLTKPVSITGSNDAPAPGTRPTWAQPVDGSTPSSPATPAASAAPNIVTTVNGSTINNVTPLKNATTGINVTRVQGNASLADNTTAHTAIEPLTPGAEGDLVAHIQPYNEGTNAGKHSSCSGS